MHQQSFIVTVSYSPNFVNVLLQIASKVAAPLSKTNEIVILSGKGSQVTGEVNRLLAELPVSVNALTGVDLSKVITCFGSWEEYLWKVSEVKRKCFVSTAPVAAEDDLNLSTPPQSPLYALWQTLIHLKNSVLLYIYCIPSEFQKPLVPYFI